MKRSLTSFLTTSVLLSVTAIFSGCASPVQMRPPTNNRVCATSSTSTTPENSDDFLTISSSMGLIARCEPGVFPKVCVCSTGRRFALVLTSADDYLNRLEATCFPGGMCPLYNDDVVDVPNPPRDAVVDVPSDQPTVRADASADATTDATVVDGDTAESTDGGDASDGANSDANSDGSGLDVPDASVDAALDAG